MRDAKAQHSITMIPIGAMQQPPEPHVRHAERGDKRPGIIRTSNHGPVITTASAAPC